jgi:hypothetical protein
MLMLTSLHSISSPSGNSDISFRGRLSHGHISSLRRCQKLWWSVRLKTTEQRDLLSETLALGASIDKVYPVFSTASFSHGIRVLITILWKDLLTSDRFDMSCTVSRNDRMWVMSD